MTDTNKDFFINSYKKMLAPSKTLCQKDFIFSGYSYGEVFELAAGLKKTLSKRGKDNTLCLCTENKAVIAACIVASLAGSLFLRKSELTRVRAEAEALAPASDNAKRLVREWKEFRSAIDPRAFAIDQLAAVAEGVAGDKIRLTQFTLDGGRLLLAGEAGDVAQAYQFFDYIKKSPALQDYDWVSRQPQLAGKTKVRFEMEGSRPDAKTGTE